MAKLFPRGYNNYEEYIGYYDCIMRAELGSKVFVFIDTYGNVGSYVQSKIRELVVGKTKPGFVGTRHLLLSALHNPPGFLYRFIDGGRKMSWEYRNTYDMVSNIDKYEVFYKGYPDDIRIASIVAP